ncbi:MAG: ATP-dependent RNA helicase RhlB [Gammaproteobacteria bacterium]|nr:ATP-dependent RNA helicase RhlB [Gammaproteobacteria bacterium]NNJ97564.1 ATP-dependent RNA helicase RhlB [Gammaproteobacteria bacterium]
MSEHHLTETRYASFDLVDEINQGLADAGFEFCTPIQQQTLPIALEGRDVAGEAQTGTGKTAAFLIAVFNQLLKHPPSEKRRKNQPRALILAPTRELAIQIHKDALLLGSHTGLVFGLAYGGTGYETQREELAAGVDLLIGTPGRIIDYFKQHVFDLKACQVVVLDEADRMFDLGFIKDIRYLLRRCPVPEKRLSMLFSATLSHRVLELAYEHMNNAETVRIRSDRPTADKVKQTVYYPANDEKVPLLLGLLESLQPTRSIIFVNTKRVAEKLFDWLEGNGHKTALLSGDVPQKKRQSLLRRFQDGEYKIMVATDVAARGLHIPEVSHIFNYDLPQSGEDYVHRVGRTARAGASGAAVSFACEDYAHYLVDIEDYIGHRIDNVPVDQDSLLTPKAPLKRKPKKPRGSGQHRNRHKHGKDKTSAGGKHGDKRHHKHRKSHQPKKVKQGASDSA